ncbi:hypothetical protein N7462_010969 [Penicillium macrosclerotiorum]|uniref:uncharacterized protein n=1 Tax=Penicillium macrosclerotiorum TaxID=303699 RepID=UPI00254743CB|nr:uncharacterized protein N7462_010969 [Penicillium macrosclerotiorum]KAJ5666560.1 hypothetical protein N7462_010969 [Penicillium macrosclerotiorum]
MEITPENVTSLGVLWCTSCHRDVLRISYGSNPVLDIKDQLYYKGRILNLLREQVTDFAKEEWRDGVIMAIFRDPNPFTPPFVDMQSLSFYGSRDYHTLHWIVIYNMLRYLPGGIQSIKLFALGCADLMNAAHSLTKPLFPIVDVEGNVTLFPPPLRAFPFPADPSEKIELGFRDLQSSHPPVKDTIVESFNLLSLYSTMLQWRYCQQLDPSDCDRFADFRNQVHHTLFGLPDERDPLETVLEIRDLSTDDFSVSYELFLAD